MWSQFWKFQWSRRPVWWWKAYFLTEWTSGDMGTSDASHLIVLKQDFLFCKNYPVYLKWQLSVVPPNWIPLLRYTFARFLFQDRSNKDATDDPSSVSDSQRAAAIQSTLSLSLSTISKRELRQMLKQQLNHNSKVSVLQKQQCNQGGATCGHSKQHARILLSHAKSTTFCSKHHQDLNMWPRRKVCVLAIISVYNILLSAYLRVWFHEKKPTNHTP